MTEPTYDILELPLDDEGYVVSFDKDEPDQYLPFLHEYGFVVIRDVLSSEELERARDDVWSVAEQRGINVHRDDHTTWTNDNWCGMTAPGFTGGDPLFTSCVSDIRQKESLYEIFCQVYNRRDLWVSIDRSALFRPSFIEDDHGNLVEYPEHRTTANIHFDVNPWQYCDSNVPRAPSNKVIPDTYERLSNFCSEFNAFGKYHDNLPKVQAQINLIDNREEDGGFVLCPGFHNHISDWSNATKDIQGLGRKMKKSDRCVLPEDCKVQQHGRRITMRSGSLCIWSGLVPHGSSPNFSTNLRMAYFIKYFPAQRMNSQRRRILTQKLEENNVEITELGQYLFGFKNYSKGMRKL